MSWLASLMSALGSGASEALGAAESLGARGLDEASLIGQGFMDESNESYTPERFQARAIDRATDYYTGDTLGISDLLSKNSVAGPEAEPKGMEGNAEGDSPVTKLATLKAQQKLGIPELDTLRDLEADSETMANSGRSKGKAALSDMFVARGNSQIMRGAVPEGESAYVGDTFSKSKRPIPEQYQISQLRRLGVPQQSAEAMIDNGSEAGARDAIMKLTQKSLQSKQEMVQAALADYQKNVAKADNKEAVLSALVMQLRNLQLSDPAIQMMLMSLQKPTQVS
jgi:hypothetical protein